MNEIMKVLTIITAIFAPLSFLAGVYGMNFHTDISRWNMPELSWQMGSLWALGLMGVVTVIMLAYFRRRGWL
jgi:magnesium transporter